ncbi:MAG: PEP/pyruvate-binding domain-containing protein [Arthrobacter sp.]
MTQRTPTDDGSGGLVLDLAQLNAGMLALVGGKAANLGELLSAGLPVPEGFCLTTAAYRQAIGATDALLPPLAGVYAALGDGAGAGGASPDVAELAGTARGRPGGGPPGPGPP